MDGACARVDEACRSIQSSMLNAMQVVSVAMFVAIELKDPGVMETTQEHVLLQSAINQSGLLENCMHVRRGKRAMVSQSAI